MKTSNKAWWLFAAGVVVAANIAVWVTLRPQWTRQYAEKEHSPGTSAPATLPELPGVPPIEQDGHDAASHPASAPATLPAVPSAPAVTPATVPAVSPESSAAGQPASGPSIPKLPASQPALSAEQAQAEYVRGLEAVKAGQFLQARTELNRLYFSGALPADTQDALRTTLAELANSTIIGRGTPALQGDPYTMSYQLEAGEVLAKVERKLELHVPWQLLLRVNSLSRSEDLQAGTTYKMVRGPFHAVVSKSRFTMDIFLQREGQERLFIRRLPVGTGKDDSTPVGLWRVRLGGKQQKPTWFPPPNSPLRGPVQYGSPDYAFGEKGLWISLEGLDDQTRGLADYGIHSTNDPGSIGKAGSLGCIRMSDEDIDLAYTLLYEYWSTVEVVP